MTHTWWGRGLSVALCAVALAGAVGCGRSRRKSSLLMERPAYGRIEAMASVAKPVAWRLEPAQQTKTERGVEATVEHASPEFLKQFFSNRDIFQNFAGSNPFFPEHLVFYVRLANRSERRVSVNPGAFVLVDDLGTQYHPIGVDYITAFEEYRRGFSTMTRNLFEDASPGYFGVSVPVGRLFFKKPQARFALATQTSFKAGPLFPGVVYDGLVPYWGPSTGATRLRLILSNVKADFDANDVPKTAFEIAFDFAVARP
jgi:hypothetical protein